MTSEGFLNTDAKGEHPNEGWETIMVFVESRKPAFRYLAFLIPPLFVFWRYKVSLDTNGNIRFGFLTSLCSKTLQVNDIASHEIIPDTWTEFYGYGIRFRCDGSVGYICGSGPGIRIRTYSGKTYVFSCNDAYTLSRLLDELV
eukprot:CAMPEP_0203758082 /NCGR_PEP_ID=MMETSP0098-20131031/10842_1 /ASSEMBLY_ACC=CAM_ASM_000208 /TAXON_ID=96639 /ORGANISM=" , Strain NY0313808BC1" /LENGTH=142 /DNA_ID=CAMNT_0050650329 /DNA_START=2001 /DNA_END=2426 /DNA_ORIENTATION=-